ncbi:MAG: flagellar biosynthesis protein FlhA [Planctomycetota bacterium]|jgi:flagellar biosynthesis protein FlhA|nr:flagellar biosynthesis protein FlhA [Planctomycetota bacterium]
MAATTAAVSSPKDKLLALLGKVANAQHALIPIFIVFTLVTIIYPLPGWMMDFLLGLNITLSLMLLLSCIYVTRPTEMGCFPSILLILTMFRLSLNISTTRLILTRAPTLGDHAAGDIVYSFGAFVTGAGGEQYGLIVGLVIFTIIVVIQVMVITKGATRIAEVAARFTLDAMPGRQMAIDADLQAGTITDKEAQARRDDIRKLADFYGAMDGAAKFVQGDTMAGIVITLVNIGAGFIIGVTLGGMELADAAQTFTKLTIGDGLVGQLPALMISVGSGLLVSRGNEEGNFGGEIFKQYVNNRKALGLATVMVLLTGLSGALGITPFPAVPLMLIAAVCGAWWWRLGFAGDLDRQQAEAEAAKEKEAEKPKEEKVEDFLKIDPMALTIGYGLVSLVDAKQAENGGGNLLQRISMIRQQMATELGIIVPPIRIRDNAHLKHNEYAIEIQGNEVARGLLEPDRLLAVDAGQVTQPIDGIEGTEPAFGMPAVWITDSQREKAEQRGYAVVDADSVVATHLTEVIRTRSAELLNNEEVNRLLENVKESLPNLVAAVIPNPVSPFDLQKVLQNLLRERVSVRNLPAILEVLAEVAPRAKDFEILTAHCRNKLSRQICAEYQENGTLYVVTLDPALEEAIARRIERTDSGSYLTLRPEDQRKICDGIAEQVQKQMQGGHTALLLTGPQVRLQVKRLTETPLPALAVIAYNEVLPEIKVESVGMVKVEL